MQVCNLYKRFFVYQISILVLDSDKMVLLTSV